MISSIILVALDRLFMYNSAASVSVRARPGGARVTTLRPYRVTR